MSVVISGISVVSCLGIGAEPFLDAVRAGWDESEPGDRAPQGGRIPGLTSDEDFQATKQVRLEERSSALAVGTIGKLLAAYDLSGLPAERLGVVLGSALASIDTFMTISRDSLAGAKPYHVDHKRVPACVMNYTSGQVAIRFDLRGPNVTATAGRVTGLTTVLYGQRLLRAGRADLVICGAFEEITTRRLGIEAATDRRNGLAPGEGCCAFLLESRESAARFGRVVLAEVLAVQCGLFTDPDDAGEVLARTVARALRRAGTSPDQVRLIIRGGLGDGPLGKREAAAIAGLCPTVHTVDPALVVGDTYGASAAFQVAAAIAAGRPPRRGNGIALLISMDPDGQVGCGVLRIP